MLMLNLSIHQKLLLMCLISVGVIVTIGAVAYSNTMQAISLQHSYMNDINPQLQTIRDIRRDVNYEFIASN